MTESVVGYAMLVTICYQILLIPAYYIYRQEKAKIVFLEFIFASGTLSLLLNELFGYYNGVGNFDSIFYTSSTMLVYFIINSFWFCFGINHDPTARSLFGKIWFTVCTLLFSWVSSINFTRRLLGL